VRRSSRVFSAAVAVLTLLAPGAAAAVGRPFQLEEARQLERDGDAAAAARLYLSWARERSGEPSSLAGYPGFLRTEHGLDALVDACRDLAGSLPKVPGAWPLLAETAQLFELAGLDEEAAAIAAEAWNRGGPVSLLQRALRLALAMGDLDAYSAAAARTVIVPDLDPLDSTRDLLAGRLEEARLGSSRLLAAVENPIVRLPAAWNLFEAAIALAAASGKTSRLVEAPSPSLFISAEPVPTEPPPAEKTFSVQAGSFQVRENADELVKELSRAGFDPLVREAAVQGKTVFRVFAATGLDRDSAARFLERLRTAGYAGITVGD
jgi:cell division septation protein DedD